MAFATMATDSKQLYLIFHDHRTKKRKDFDVLPSSLFYPILNVLMLCLGFKFLFFFQSIFGTE